MKRLKVIGIVIMIIFWISGSAAFSAAAKMWVSSANALLKSDKSASSKTIESLAVGAELSVVSTDQKWFRVKTRSGREGWIYRGKVSEVKPQASASQKSSSGGIGGLLGSMTGSGISANSADSSRSIRGLSPEAEEYAKQTGKPQQFRDALDSVLDLKIPESEIDQFLKQGKIGEYAE